MGPRFGEEGSSSEAVDFIGVQSAIEAAETFLYPDDGSRPTPGSVVRKTLVQPSSEGSDDGSGGPGGKWEPLDDVIMGGRSSSAWKTGVGRGVLERQSDEGMYGRWAGTLVEEGGGFCGTVIKVCSDSATLLSCLCQPLFVIFISLRCCVFCCLFSFHQF